MIKSFNPTITDATKEFMFGGNQPNVSRFDVQRFEIFAKLYEKQWGFVWTPSEVAISKDKLDFKTLPEYQQNIAMKNIMFQTMTDSIQTRAPVLALLPHVSLPELESLIVLWAAFESLHSNSYSWIMRNVYADATEVLDRIMLDPQIMKRADSLAQFYDDFIEYGSWKSMLGYGTHTINGKTIEITEREFKRKLMRCIASVNILEGVSFYVSFACSFAFAERGLLEGNAKIIEFIARDENLHLAITQNILKKWANGEDDPMMAELWKEEQGNIIQMYKDAVARESEWAAYLFEDGAMLGLTEDILIEYSKHIAGKRMRAIGLKHDYPSKNPLTWTEKYLNGSASQVAPQEVEISSYIVGGVSHDNSSVDFTKLDF